MQTVMISGALFFVMILLLLVVYDSNPTVRRIAGRLWPFRTPPSKPRRQETPMDNKDSTAPSPELIRAGTGPRHRLGRFPPFRLFPRRSHRPETVPHPGLTESAAPASKMVDASEPPTRKSPWEALAELQGAIGSLTGRLSQAETAVEKIAHLEGEVSKVAEATEIVSQDFKDILGSLRSTIDAFEKRLNEMSAQIEAVQQSTPTGPAAAAGPDEETRGRIRSLEKAIGDMADTLRPLPDDVRRALSGSRKAAGEAEELGKRLEIISSNLQMTLGYGIKKAFRCDSCGSQGFVASRVVCSKCGTASWWGWWPTNEEIAENDADETASGIDEFGGNLEADPGASLPENTEPTAQTNP